MVWCTKDYNEADPKITPFHCSPPKQSAASAVNSYLDHICKLDVQSPPATVRLTGIVATIDPSLSIESLEELMEAGMNVARIYVAHGTHETHTALIKRIREAAANFSKRLGIYFPVTIAIDIRGPEIHLGYLEGGVSAEVYLKKGEQIKLTTDKAYFEKGSASVVYVDYENIHNVVKEGHRIYIDDGLISLICTSIQGSVVTCTIENRGTLGSLKPVNLPDAEIDLPTVSEKDEEDLLLAVEQDVDAVFVSFVRSAACIAKVRKVLGKAGSKIMVVAKIENQQGVQNIEEIIKASDGLMVGRGDLGIELPPEKLFLAQKNIIGKCNKAGKPVICANQLLFSMIKRPRPTRAECTDVANAVLDGSDNVMLTGETASGEHPALCIKTMSRICREAEAAIWYEQHFMDLLGNIKPPIESSQAICIAAIEAAVKCGAGAIIVMTVSGKSAHLLARYRPNCPIIAVTREPTTARQAHLFRGIIPLLYQDDQLDDWQKDIEERIRFGISFGKWQGLVKAGDPVVIVHGSRRGSGYTDTLKVMYVLKPTIIGDGCHCEEGTELQ